MTLFYDLKVGCTLATRTLRTIRGKVAPSMDREGRSRMEYDVAGVAMEAVRIVTLLLGHNPDVGMPVSEMERLETEVRRIKDLMLKREREYQTRGRLNV